MRAIRTHAGPLGVVLAVAVALAGVALLAAPSGKQLFSQAEAQYARHNYKQALALADRVLGGAPSDPLKRSAQRLKLLSMCKLRDQNGYAYGKKLMDEHKPFAKDPDLWRAMGDERFGRWDRRNAYECYKRAADLYEKQAKHTPAADAYFRQAECLRRHYDLLPVQRATNDWSKRRRLAVEEAVRLYEHIVTLKVDTERKGRALYLAGQRCAELGDWKSAARAIGFYRRCVKEFPRAPAAPNAQYRIGLTFERFARYVEAVAEYRKAIEDYPTAVGKAAKERIDGIKAPQITVGIDKPFLPGEKVELFWRIRNVKKVHLTAHRVDLLEAVAKVTTVSDTLSVIWAKRGEQVASWVFDTPDEGKHQIHGWVRMTEGKQTTQPIRVPFSKTGAYVLRAWGVNPDNKSAESRCLVLFSKLAAVAKADADQVMIFANDAVSGAPAEGAQAGVTRYWGKKNSRPQFDRARGKLNDAGLADLKMPRRRWCHWVAAVKRGEDQALCGRGSFSWSWWGYGNDLKVYGFTERPVYRPKQTVHFKQILRRHSEGVYTNYAKQKVRVSIRDPKGKTIYAKDLITDEYGTVEGELTLGAEPPLGVYSIQVRAAGRNLGYWYARGNRFRVEEYKKPEFKVTIEPGAPDYRVGDEIRIKIAARYYFGQPVADAEVRYTIRKQSYTHHYVWPRPWKWYYDYVHYGGRYGRRPWYPWWQPRFDELVSTGTIKTDANGAAFVVVKADPVKGHEKLDLKFVVKAQVTDASRRVIRGSGEVKVTHAPFFIYPKPAARVYGPGDSVEIRIKTEDPNKKPVPGEFAVEAWRVERVRKVVKKDGAEQVEFEEKLAQKLFAKDVQVSPTGRASVRFVPDVTGHLKVIVRQKKPKKGAKPVEGSCTLWIASKTGVYAHYAYSDLKLVPAKDQYEIGQTLKVLVNTNKPNSYVLLTGEADDLLFARVVHVPKNSKLIEVRVDKKLCPNFALTASLLRDNKLYMDSKNIIVPPTHRFLKVQVQMGKGSRGGGQDNKFQPREKSKVRVKLTDVHTKKPVVGQVCLMMVDSSIYYIQPEFRQAIEKAFYGFTRYNRVSTANSYAGPASINPMAQIRPPGHWGRRGDLANAEMDAAEAPRAPAKAAPPMEKKKRADEAPPGDLAEAEVRKFFKDTVLWAGSVVTDADGTAEVPVTLPDQLTTFALHAIAVDKDTRVGQAKSDVITTKRVIVRLQSGRFFTEGDHSYVTVIAHNYYKQALDVFVDLQATEELTLRKVNVAGRWRAYESGQPLKVNVPGNGEVRLDFLTTAIRPGEVKLTARARSVKESDALELTKPIVPWGAGKIVAEGGALRGPRDKAGEQSAEWQLTVPEKIKPGSQSLTVTLSPSIAAVAVDALPYLARYPYGCTEQTMSRFLPTVVMRKTLQQAGVSLDDVRKLIEHRAAADKKHAARYKLIRQRMRRNPVYSSAEVDKMIDAGIKRLKSFQHGDGGWGWWKRGQSDPYMTAYVLMGLTVARDCDVKLPPGMIQRAAKWLVARAGQPRKLHEESWWYRHINNLNTRAFMLYAISRSDAKALRADKKLQARLKEIYDARDELSDYGRSYLALALQAAGQKQQATVVVENFDNTATVDKKTSSAFWGRRHGWWYWYHGATETTAWVLQAMMTVRPKDKYIPMAVNYLVRNRRELYWYNTKSTAMVVYALAQYAKATGELDCDQTFEVVIDDAVRKTVRVTRENLFGFDDRIVVSADNLQPGKHTVRVRRAGKGSLYWGAYLRYFDQADVIKGGGNQLAITRKYFRLVPEKFQNTRRVWKSGKWVEEKFPDLRYKKEPLAFGGEIASGELIEVRLDIEADNNLEYVLFEDAKPSGCEPYRLRSGSTYGGGTYANMELRDTRVVFFANWVARGKRTLTYKLVCEQPGTFRVLPTSGEAMYSPFVEAISDSGKLTITVKPEKK